MKDVLSKPLAFIDVETTGTNPRSDRIIEIGIIRVEKNKITDTLNSLINPQAHIPEQITQMTGISRAEIEQAPIFEEVIGKILEMLDDSIFIAHNARFDYAFIKNEFARYETKFNAKVLCTARLSRKLYPHLGRHNLDSIINHFNIECANRHRAYDDAKVLWDFYQIILHDHKEDKIKKALKPILKTPSLPRYLKSKDFDNLPESPGLYVFSGADGITLYIGKSVNIKDRVKSHFSSDYLTPSDLKISKEIKSIDFIETAGELGALVREADVIKKTQPVYNRRLRRSRGLIAAIQSTTLESYNSCSFKDADKITTEEIDQIISLFESKKKAFEVLHKIAQEYKLCPKLLGLEKGKGACFNYQIEKCKGACIGIETPLEYNLRYVQAFADFKVPPWPFESLFAIEEETFDKKEIHVVNKWCYLGSISTNGKIDEPEVFKKEARFDWDTYKILKRFVLKKNSKVKLRKLTNTEENLLFKNN